MPSRSTKSKQSDQKNASLLEKIAAAQHALQKYIKPNMRIALGSGSTAEEFIKALANAPEKRPEMCIASSRKSLALAKKLGLPIAEDKELTERNSSAENPIEMIIDGADEIDSKLRLIKGGGGCLLREKILAQSCAKMIVIAEKNKVKKQLGAFPLPVEIEPFAWRLTRRKVVSLFENVMQRKGSAVIRGGSEKPELTDGGNMTLDCAWGEWKPKNVATLAKELDKIPGVLENGIFEHEASTCVLASYKQGKVTITEINKKSPVANIKRSLEQRWLENSIKLQQGLKTLSLATKRRLAFLQAVVKERQL